MNFKPNIQTLDNGLQTVFLPLPQSQSVTALIMVKVGSRYENDKIAGLAHFIEHMVFKGTEKYPSALDLSTVVDSVGAEFNAFTGKENTAFYVKSAAKHLMLSLDVLRQMIFRPLLEEKEINKEKGVILEEINMREDMPMSKVSEEFESLLYGKTVLGRDVIGFKKTVKNMQRRHFLNFRQQWYQPSRMLLAIAGRIKKGERLKIQGLVEKHFSSQKKSQKKQNYPKRLTTVSHLKNKPLVFQQKKPAVRMIYKPTQQAHFCLGVRSFPRGHKDRYALAVLATILGGNMSSRLFTEVREKRGLAYYVKTQTNAYSDNGYLVSQAGTDINKAKEAIKVILNEYKKASFWLTEKELKRSQEFIKGKMALALEDSKTIVTLYADDLLLEGKIRTPQMIIKKIDEVSLSDLKRVAKKIFKKQLLNLAIIGPYKNKDQFERILI